MLASIRTLAAQDQLSLCTSVKDAREVDALGDLADLGVHLFTESHVPSRVRALPSALMRGEPTPITQFFNPALRSRVERMLVEERFDLIWCHFLTGAAHVPDTDVPMVLDQHNVDSDHWRQIESGTRNVALQAVAAWNRAKWIPHEKREFGRFRWILSVSERDAERSRSIAPRSTSVAVVPNGVNPPDSPPPLPGSNTVLFCASMHVLMNHEAGLWLVEAVVPLVRQEMPDVRFLLVGGHPRRSLRSAAARVGVEVLGWVPTMGPYYAEGQVATVPLKMGGGTKIKALEAMAYGRPVVTTSVGARGFPVVDGRDALVADDEVAFAASIVALLRDRERAAAVGEAGQRLASQFTWTHVYGGVRSQLAGELTRS